MALAIAQRYSTALSKALPATALNPDSALAQLRSLEEALNSSPELRAVFSSPAIAIGDKHALARKIGERLGFSTAIRNFVFVLLDHGRIPILGEVIECFSAWLDEKAGLARIEVSSAAELDNAQRWEIVNRFTKLLGKRIEATFSIDPQLLGGAVVRVGGRLYDGSTISQLKNLSRSMTG